MIALRYAVDCIRADSRRATWAYYPTLAAAKAAAARLQRHGLPCIVRDTLDATKAHAA